MCLCVCIVRKGRPQNDLYCVGRDVKPYSLTFCHAATIAATVCHCTATVVANKFCMQHTPVSNRLTTRLENQEKSGIPYWSGKVRENEKKTVKESPGKLEKRSVEL